MKMGTSRSLSRYDAGARHALQQQVCDALRFRNTPGGQDVIDIATWSAFSFNRGAVDQMRRATAQRSPR
jgi:hypothetical protein